MLRKIARWIFGATTKAPERIQHRFIVVGAWPLTNVVMCSWPEKWAAFNAAAQYARKHTGVEFVIYERGGSVTVSERVDEPQPGEQIGEFDDEPETESETKTSN